MSLSLGFSRQSVHYAAALAGGGKGSPDNELLSLGASCYKERQEKLFAFMQEKRTPVSSPSYTSLNALLSYFCTIDEALFHVKHAVEENNEAPVKLLLAELCYSTGSLEEAGTMAETLIDDSACSNGARRLLESIRLAQAHLWESPAKGILGGLFWKGEKSSREAGTCFLEGLQKFHHKSYREALSFFQEALRLDETLKTCWFFAGSALIQSGDTGKGEHCIETFRQNHPDSPGYYRFLALDEKRNDNEENFTQWIMLSPGEPFPWIDYLRWLVDTGREEDARLAASEIIETHIQKWRITEKSYHYWNLRGFMELFIARTESALLCFDRSISMKADNPLALTGKARCLAGMGRLDEALVSLNILIHHTSVVSCYERTHIYMAMDREKESTQALEEGLVQIPRSPLLNYKKAEHLLHFRDYRGFFTFYAGLSFLYGRFPPLTILKAEALCQNGRHLGKGIALFRRPDYTGSRGAFLECLKLVPMDAGVMSWIGALEFESGNYSLSLKYFSRVLGRGGISAHQWNNLAVYHYRKGDLREALLSVEKSLRARKENPGALLTKGLCDRDLGKLEEAYNAIKLALYYQPRNSYAWLQRCLLEYDMDQLKLSLESSARCNEVNNREPWLFYNRALIALKPWQNLWHRIHQAPRPGTCRLCCIEGERRKICSNGLWNRRKLLAGKIFSLTWRSILTVMNLSPPSLSGEAGLSPLSSNYPLPRREMSLSIFSGSWTWEKMCPSRLNRERRGPVRKRRIKGE